MDSVRPSPAPKKSKFAKKFQKVMNPTKSSSKNLLNNAFCLLIPQENLKCCESQQLFKEDLEEAAKESKNKAVLEAFVAKLFATISSVKAAYAELQMAQFPYNNEAIQSADQTVVYELKSLSELKHCFFNKKIDYSSPPHVTLLLSEIQEQQSLMKTYEITMKKMQNEIEAKGSLISLLKQELNGIFQNNKSLEKKMNASGSFSVLDNVKFSDKVNHKDFIMVLHYGLRSIRNFVKFLIKEMEVANWDIEAAAASSIINHQEKEVIFFKKDHKGFAFESFACREIFSGFNGLLFGIQIDNSQSWPNGNYYQRRIFYFEEFKKVKSVNVLHFLKQNPNSLLGKFLKSKYLQLVHPKMEFSFSGNLNQRKLVNSGDFPETEFFKAFAEMGRRVWLLHCLAFSFDQEISIFQVKKNCRFSEMYMESVTDEVFSAATGSDFRVAFTVVPGFKVGNMVVQSQVYLSPAISTAAK